MASKKVR